MAGVDLTRFDFNAKDFMHSDNVRSMNLQEIGQYVLLLCEAWLTDKDASLPSDIEALTSMCRGKSPSDKVLKMFPVVPETGRLRNPRLYTEWMLAKKRSQDGRGAAELRWEKQRNATALPEHETGSANFHKVALPKPSQTNPYQTKSTEDDYKGAGTFKNIAIQYSSFFGGHHSKGKKHIERYQQACSKYGEDKVLEYFKRWAEGSGWLRDRRDPNGLNFFWKPLDEMAEGDTLREEREQSTSQSEQIEKIEVNLAMAADQSKRDEEVQKELTRIAKEKEFEEAHRYEI